MSKQKDKGSIVAPAHYTKLDPEPIEVIEKWEVSSFHLGNVIKYIARYASNWNVDDLRKAEWYLNRYISYISSENE
jgi:hypothetical protein